MAEPFQGGSREWGMAEPFQGGSGEWGMAEPHGCNPRPAPLLPTHHSLPTPPFRPRTYPSAQLAYFQYLSDSPNLTTQFQSHDK